jgi:DNA primase
MAFSPQFLDDLKIRTSLAEVVGKRVKLIKKGHEFSGLCPFHNEKTPSFTLNEEKGFYHCFGCQSHGSAIDFIMETEGLGFRETVERLATDAGIQIPDETPEQRERERRKQTLYDVTEAATVFFEKMLYMPEGKHALDYLTKRGLNRNTLKTFRVGFSPNNRSSLKNALLREEITVNQMTSTGMVIKPTEDKGQGMETYDRFRGRVMFPISDRQGRVIAFGGRVIGTREPKYLNSPETPLFHKGSELYGLHIARPAAHRTGTILVTEGYMDVIALHQAGFQHAVAPLGTAITEDQIHLLWKIVPEPILCLDGDRAGQAAAGKAAIRALPLLKPGFGIRFATLPTSEDPDSLIKKNGAHAMQSVLDASIPLSESIWRMETGGRMPTSPEDKASLQQRLKDHARAIQDSTVRNHFSKAFNQWVNPEGSQEGNNRQKKWRANWQSRPRDGWASNMQLETTAGPAAKINIVKRREEILLTTLINHPGLYDDVSENLGNIAFLTLKLDKIRQEVLKTLATKSSLETEAIINHLNECGYLVETRYLLGTEVYGHAYFARPEASFKEAKAGWEETFGQIKGKDLIAEIKEAERDVSENPSDEAWRRFIALKRQKMDEKVDGQSE